MANVDVELEMQIMKSLKAPSKVLLILLHMKKIFLPVLYIYMVPSWFRVQSPTCFDPRVVSIGPLHREDEYLKEFEVQKQSTVHKLLHRYVKSCPAEQTLKSCVQKVIGSIDQIRDSYAGMKKTYNDADLAEMMVMDGCFVLAFFHNYLDDKAVVRNKLLQNHLIYDLLLLENQIPFFVLEHIFHVCLKFGFKGPLRDFMLPVLLKHPHLFDENLDRKKMIDNVTSVTPHHILGLLHQCYRPQDSKKRISEFPRSSNHSVVDLDRAGVNFKPGVYFTPNKDDEGVNYFSLTKKMSMLFKKTTKKDDAKWLLAMEVEFHRIPILSWVWARPTLRMPVLPIHDNTALIFRNLMAYEQSSSFHSYVTSDVKAMDMLVNTQEDIAMLVESKVLKNNIGSNDEAADMMNRLCKGIAHTNSFYSHQWEMLDDYYNGSWPKHAARLRRTYFASPWNIIALVAGTLLFALTVVQTICSLIEVVR